MDQYRQVAATGQYFRTEEGAGNCFLYVSKLKGGFIGMRVGGTGREAISRSSTPSRAICEGNGALCDGLPMFGLRLLIRYMDGTYASYIFGARVCVSFSPAQYRRTNLLFLAILGSYI